MKINISQIKTEFELQMGSCASLQDLEKIKTDFLGRKGFILNATKTLKNLGPEEKKQLGMQINFLKKEIEGSIEEKFKALSSHKNETLSAFDVTAYNPKKGTHKGNTHFYTKFFEEIENIFISMGFDVFDGKEIETDQFNFTHLNIPEEHPARDMYDTLWVDVDSHLLRTHTSPVQIHQMLKFGAPLAGIAPGRTFRHEATDATHEVVFSQCEGILVDENISLSHLFGIAKKFLSKLFDKKNLEIRVRPGFFPFVEPGVEIDMKCIFCKSGCKVCKKTTWIEVFPGGLIHPNVLKAGKIDPEIYSGFAFGFGIERLAMLRHKINDIRHFKSGNIKFLKQF